MKKTYLSPEVEITRVSLEQQFLASGENLTSRNYIDPDDGDDCFWE